MTGDRAELADFLRTRREALQPEDVGMPRGARRRTGGLRREEVAALSGMSADYYGRIEQRRGPHPSEQMLAALARGLRLSLDDSSSESRSPRADRGEHLLARVRAALLLDAAVVVGGHPGQGGDLLAAQPAGAAARATRHPDVLGLQRLAAGAEEVGELRAVPGHEPILLEPHPARGLDPLPGDPAHALGQDRGGGAADVVGLADPAHRVTTR